jgi:dTDP-4-dehydrorhamnose reductase
MVGSAIVRQIQERGDAELILRTRAELDLTNQQAVAEFFKIEQSSGVRSCILHSLFFKLWIFYSYLV